MDRDIVLWVDDLRPMREGFNTHAKSADEAISILATGRVRVVSLDHDLGAGAGTGYDVAKYIEKAVHDGKIQIPSWFIHSANSVGSKNILAALTSAQRFANRNC
jgi:hypothetical protein